jgi:fatty acid desaturase
MIRSLLVLAVVGIVGLAVAGIVFSVMVPLLVFAVKVAAVLLAGYVVLKLVRPDLAEECRRKIRGES